MDHEEFDYVHLAERMARLEAGQQSIDDKITDLGDRIDNMGTRIFGDGNGDKGAVGKIWEAIIPIQRWMWTVIGGAVVAGAALHYILNVLDRTGGRILP